MKLRQLMLQDGKRFKGYFNKRPLIPAIKSRDWLSDWIGLMWIIHEWQSQGFIPYVIRLAKWINKFCLELS